MTDADAFLDALYVNFEDDLPRLVFADWLEEQGEGEYAAFIRLSCQIERGESLHPAERQRLRKERYHLRQVLTARWCDLVPSLRFEQTFTDRWTPTRTMSLYTAGFLIWTGPYPRFLPSRVLLLDFEGLEADLARCHRLAEVSDLWFVKSWDTTPSEMPFHSGTEPLLRALTQSRHLGALRGLTLYCRFPSRKGLTEFAASSLADQLESFNFVSHIDPVWHYRVEVQVTQPPAGAVREAIHRFLDEYGDSIPEE